MSSEIKKLEKQLDDIFKAAENGITKDADFKDTLKNPVYEAYKYMNPKEEDPQLKDVMNPHQPEDGSGDYKARVMDVKGDKVLVRYDNYTGEDEWVSRYKISEHQNEGALAAGKSVTVQWSPTAQPKSESVTGPVARPSRAPAAGGKGPIPGVSSNDPYTYRYDQEGDYFEVVSGPGNIGNKMMSGSKGYQKLEAVGGKTKDQTGDGAERTSKGRESFKQGLDATNNGDHSLAAKFFNQSYNESKHPLALFNHAKSRHDNGEAKVALNSLNMLKKNHPDAWSKMVSGEGNPTWKGAFNPEAFRAMLTLPEYNSLVKETPIASDKEPGKRNLSRQELNSALKSLLNSDNRGVRRQATRYYRQLKKVFKGRDLNSDIIKMIKQSDIDAGGLEEATWKALKKLWSGWGRGRSQERRDKRLNRRENRRTRKRSFVVNDLHKVARTK